jgi:hypothetical protein
MKTDGENFHTFLASELDGGEWFHARLLYPLEYQIMELTLIADTNNI